MWPQSLWTMSPKLLCMEWFAFSLSPSVNNTAVAQLSSTMLNGLLEAVIKHRRSLEVGRSSLGIRERFRWYRSARSAGRSLRRLPIETRDSDEALSSCCKTEVAQRKVLPAFSLRCFLSQTSASFWKSSLDLASSSTRALITRSTSRLTAAAAIASLSSLRTIIIGSS